MQAVGKEGDEDMCLDAVFALMVDGSDGQVSFDVLKGFLDLRGGGGE